MLKKFIVVFSIILFSLLLILGNNQVEKPKLNIEECFIDYNQLDNIQPNSAAPNLDLFYKNAINSTLLLGGGDIWSNGTNIFTVHSYINTSKDIVITKWDMAGQVIWNRTWDNATDSGNAIWADNSNIYVCGTTDKSNARRLVVLKYDYEGNLVWDKIWGPESLNYGAEGNGICGYNEGGHSYIYTTGQSRWFNPDGSFIVIKWNDDGTIAWNNTWEGPDDSDERGYKCWVNSTDLLTTGRVYQDLVKGFVIRWDSNTGNIIWEKTITNYVDGLNLHAITVQNAYIYCVGRSTGSTPHMFCIKMDFITGNQIFNCTYNTTHYAMDSTENILVDTTGIYLCGESKDRIIGVDAIYLRYSLDGELLWYNQWRGDGNASARGLYKWGDNLYTVGFTNPSYNGKWSFYLNRFSNITSLVYPAKPVLLIETEFPDHDGNITLMWNQAERADNYSIYKGTSEIIKINSSLELILKETQLTEYSLHLNSGDHYFIIVAQNSYGNTSSNCVYTLCQIFPEVVQLTTDAGDPDLNGAFKILWTMAPHTDNYSLFWSKHQILDVHASGVNLRYTGLALEYSITEWEDGIFYFVILTENEFGENISQNLKVTIQTLPPVDPIEWWVQAILYGAISAAAGIFVKQLYSSMKSNQFLIKRINQILDSETNIEDYIQSRLEIKDWVKIKDWVQLYSKRDLNKKQLIQRCKNQLGKKFSNIFKNENEFPELK